MVRHLPASHFFIFLFVVAVVLLCSTLCVAGDGASGSSEETGKVSAKLFAPGKIPSVQVFDKAGQSSPKPITFCQIKLPFLLFAANDDVIVAVTEGEQKDACESDESGGEKIGVVAKFIETKDDNKWDKDNIETTIGTWTSQLATENNGQAKTFSTVMATAVNAKKNKIYVFLLDSTVSDGSEKWEFKLLCGTIGDAEGNSKKVDWKTEEVPELKLVENVKGKLNKKITSVSLDDGSAFLMQSGKILFVVKGTSKEGGSTAEENFAAYFQYDENQKSKDKKLELLSAESTAGWYPSFFEWNGKIYKTPTNTDSDKVMVFNASQNKSFTEINSGPISRLRDFLKDKNNFSTATTKDKEEKSVLLFTQQKPTESDDSKKDVHLWMTDGTRVGYVGPIITGFKDISYGPVLHANNNLFVLHQNYNIKSGETQQKEFNITLLDGQLDTIKDTMTTWENTDKKIEGLCKDAFTTALPCLTDGPVGFLSGNKSKEEWKNEYLNVNAKLSNEKSGVVRKNVQNGFKFSGSGAGAQWPVGEQGQDQPYNFKNLGFTLVATVTIDGSNTSGSHNSILGIGFTGNKKNVGLWCTTSGKWGVKVGDGQVEVTPSAVVCAPDKKYYVALILNGTEVLVYVNGKKVADLKSNKIEGGDKISYFYFGAYADNSPTLAKTDVTIADVLLYNRPFTAEEVAHIKPKQNGEADSQQKREDEISKLPKHDKNATEPETETSSSTSATEKEEAAQSSSSTEDGAVRVGVVGVLCFMFFGVFTLLGRYVY